MSRIRNIPVYAGPMEQLHVKVVCHRRMSKAANDFAAELASGLASEDVSGRRCPRHIVTCFKQDGSVAESQIWSNYLRLHDSFLFFCFFLILIFWCDFVGIRVGELQTIWICISIGRFSSQRAPMEAGVPWKHWEPWALMRCGISADLKGFEAVDVSRFTRCSQ